MKLASVLTPLSDYNLALAAQTGVEEIVCRYPGHDLALLDAAKARIEAFGMRMGVIEGLLPIDNLKLGRDDGTEMTQMKSLLRHLGELGVPMVCYNFMAGTDWIRTSVDAPERGGAKVTAFDIAQLATARIPGRRTVPRRPRTRRRRAHSCGHNLEAFLDELLPVAEDAGVVLAMHPDDPPLPSLLGNDRIMHCVEGFERLVGLAPSPSNKIAFCQGSFAEMGVDIPAVIRQLGPHIAYVHFRDVIGTAECFTETWQDTGQTDMAAAMRAYREIGFDGPIRPDHVPQMIGEDDGEPGYTMLGRLFAFGYIRGIAPCHGALSDVRSDRPRRQRGRRHGGAGPAEPTSVSSVIGSPRWGRSRTARWPPAPSTPTVASPARASSTSTRTPISRSSPTGRARASCAKASRPRSSATARSRHFPSSRRAATCTPTTWRERLRR